MNLENIQITKDCIFKTVHWGKNVITNVCNGNIIEIPWGFALYFGYCVLLLLSVAFIVLIFLVLIQNIKSN